MEQKKILTEEEIKEWRAGEQRRSAYWDDIIKKHVERAEDILTPCQIREVDEYWSQWKEKVNPSWAAWYTRANGHFDPCYIPHNIYFGRISRALNRRDYLEKPLFQDKNYTDLLFPELLRPVTIVRSVFGQFLSHDYRPISAEEAARICLEEEEVVIKPSLETKQAKNVEFFCTEGRSKADFLQIFQEREKDFVVQKVLKQNQTLALLNPDSVNTIRVLSLLWKGEVHILGAVVRIGTKGVRVDNLVRSNGVSCAIKENGQLIQYAYDKYGYQWSELPNGIRLDGYMIPSYDRIIEVIKRTHPKLAHFKLIGWDFTVTDENEPLLIEANLDTPAVSFHQFAVGPVFGNGELLKQVLEFTYEQYPMY